MKNSRLELENDTAHVVYLILTMFSLILAFFLRYIDAHLPVLGAALVCFIQFVRPTVIGWIAVFMICSLFFSIVIFNYWEATMRSIEFSSTLLNWGENVTFLFPLSIMGGVFYGLWRVRPRRVKENSF